MLCIRLKDRKRAGELVRVLRWDTHPGLFGILARFLQLARKRYEYWRFLRSRILHLLQLLRMNSANFGLNQTPKTPKKERRQGALAGLVQGGQVPAFQVCRLITLS